MQTWKIVITLLVSSWNISLKKHGIFVYNSHILWFLGYPYIPVFPSLG